MLPSVIRGKVLFAQTMRAFQGSTGIAPPIPNLSIRWRYIVSLMPQPLYPWGKEPWHLLNTRFSKPQSQFKTFWRTEKLLALARIQILDNPAHSPADSIWNTLTQLSKPSLILKIFCFDHTGFEFETPGLNTLSTPKTTRMEQVKTGYGEDRSEGT
jgi:hypothetical protein